MIFINTWRQQLSGPVDEESSEIGETQDKLFLRDLLRIRCLKPHISNSPPHHHHHHHKSAQRGLDRPPAPQENVVSKTKGAQAPPGCSGSK